MHIDILDDEIFDFTVVAVRRTNPLALIVIGEGRPVIGVLDDSIRRSARGGAAINDQPAIVVGDDGAIVRIGLQESGRLQNGSGFKEQSNGIACGSAPGKVRLTVVLANAIASWKERPCARRNW